MTTSNLLPDADKAETKDRRPNSRPNKDNRIFATSCVNQLVNQLLLSALDVKLHVSLGEPAASSLQLRSSSEP